MTAYATLTRLFGRIGAIEDAAGVLGWDQQTIMPDGAAPGRAEQLATLRGLAHELLVAPATAGLLAAAADVGLGVWERANLREMRRRHAHATALPGDLVEASSRATSAAEMAWREARAKSDFALLLPALAEVLRLQREIGAAKGAALGLSPYDALLDQHEPGLRQAAIDPLFDCLRREIPELIRAARAHQAEQPAPTPISGRFPPAKQKALGEMLMGKVGFDFACGRLDTSLHPFCGGASGDVRITTRYDDGDFSRALMGVLHETGHALYEQGRPLAWMHQPVGEARGMVLHESQSLLVEMQACRTREFVSFLAPLVREAFGADAALDVHALSADNLHALYTRVAPGLIRVDADEVTYPAHILLRYDLERAMIDGSLALADLPGAFKDGMRALLGLAVPDDAQGCLQDIHWSIGAWGYFPTYTLGAVTAAQLFAAARAAMPDLLAHLAAADFAPLVAWLRRTVHAKASSCSTQELVTEATGRPLEVEPYLAHLRTRYTTH